MSAWASVEASWWMRSDDPALDNLRRRVGSRIYPMPGSETDWELLGNEVYEHEGRAYLETRLRDVTDMEDAALVLAWWVRTLGGYDEATLVLTFDRGPRYRYVYRDGAVLRQCGVLE